MYVKLRGKYSPKDENPTFYSVFYFNEEVLNQNLMKLQFLCANIVELKLKVFRKIQFSVLLYFNSLKKSFKTYK